MQKPPKLARWDRLRSRAQQVVPKRWGASSVRPTKVTRRAKPTRVP